MILEARFFAAKDWDKIAVEFRDVIHEQTECFNALRWQPDRVQRVAFYRDGVLVSGAVVLIIRFPVVGSGVAVVKWGPLWRKRGRNEDVAVLLATVAELRRIYAEQEGLFLSFFPRADAEISTAEVSALKACGFREGEALDDPDRYFVNTGTSSAELRSSLAQKWRYNLKKAEQNGLTSRFVEGADGLGIFTKLYNEMLERKAFHDTSAIGTLPGLMAANEQRLRPLIIVVDDREGNPVAGAVVDASGERAVYLYGATNGQALPLKAGYVMHWTIAEHLIEDPNSRWYDLGGADTDSNLHQFKKGLVGKAGVINETPCYYHYGATIKSRTLGHLLYFARRNKGRLARKLHDLRHKRQTARAR